MLNPYVYDWVVRSRFQDMQAEAEYRRLVEAARAAFRAQKLQGKRLRKGRTLKRLVTSLGYTG